MKELYAEDDDFTEISGWHRPVTTYTRQPKGYQIYGTKALAVSHTFPAGKQYFWGADFILQMDHETLKACFIFPSEQICLKYMISQLMSCIMNMITSELISSFQ